MWVLYIFEEVTSFLKLPAANASSA